MKKRMLRRLFVLLSAGIVLTGCATEAPEETETPVEESEDTEDAEGTEDADAGETADDAEEVTASIDVLIDGEAVADLSKEVTVEAGTYLMDVMHAEYDVVDEGGFLSAIEGYEQDVDAERYWMYFVNDEMAPVGAAEYELEEGDQVEWRLEDSDF